MVGRNGTKRSYSLEQVLTEDQIDRILRQEIKGTNYELICSEVKPASDGLTGYLGDHIKVVLHVKVDEGVQKVNLFVKKIPAENKPKAEFIEANNFFKREMLMFHVINEMIGIEGPNPWCVKAHICTSTLLVMPDLSISGYKEHPLLDTLDLQHVLLTAASLARFHAAFANYETNITRNVTRPYSFYQEYEHLLTDAVFKDSPWVRTAAKLTADLLDTFSTKYPRKAVPDLEVILAKSFVKACDTLDVVDGSLNVMIHKDLWNNNILFKYDKGVPTNAILIDYQCVRYGPPTFDLMIFLYLTTSRTFREEYESIVFKHYFEVFSDSLEDVTKKNLDIIGYDEEEFLSWCEKSRMFGMFEAVSIGPQVLMDPKMGDKVFNDPDTFMTIVEKDRSGPVLDYAYKNPVYKERQLELSEEFVERYVLGLP